MNKVINTISATPDRVLKVLSLLFKLKQSAILWGNPGVAKSAMAAQFTENVRQEIAEQYAENPEEAPEVTFIPIILGNYDPGELIGVQYIDEKRSKTTWYSPDFWPDYFNEDGSVNENIYIVFLDEYTLANPAQKTIAPALLYEKRIGTKQLPVNTFVLAAGNPVESGVTGYQMEPHEKTRLVHIYVVPQKEVWCEWARKNNIHPDAISFIQAHGDKYLDTLEAQLKDNVFLGTNARVWGDIVSPILWEEETGKYDKETIAVALRGAMGDLVYSEFEKFRHDVMGLPSAKEVFAANDNELARIFRNKIGNLNQLAGFCQIIYEHVQPNFASLERFTHIVHEMSKSDVLVGDRQLPAMEYAVAIHNAVFKYKYTEKTVPDFVSIAGSLVSSKICRDWFNEHEKDLYLITKKIK